MTITQRRERGGVVLEVEGSLNAAAAGEFERALLPHAGGDFPFILDFGGVDYISSMAARALITATRKHRPVHGPIIIRRLQPHLTDFMRVSGLDQILVIVPEASNEPNGTPPPKP
jgi:anti-anti-sigma factor